MNDDENNINNIDNNSNEEESNIEVESDVEAVDSIEIEAAAEVVDNTENTEIEANIEVSDDTDNEDHTEAAVNAEDEWGFDSRPPVRKKWHWLSGAVAIVAIIAIAAVLVRFNVGTVGAAGSRSDPTVARVNRTNITASDVRVMWAQAENTFMWEYFGMFPEDAAIDYDREFRDGLTFGRVVREEAVRLAAIRKLQEAYAQQMGVTVTDDERQLIVEHIDMLIEHFGADEFEELLAAEGFLNQDHLASVFEFEQLFANLLDEILTNPEEFTKFEPYMDPEEEVDNDLLGAKHILALLDNFDSEAEAEAYALDLLERVLAGEDFDMLIREYGQDPGMEANPDGYTFVSGVMVPEFEQATRELAIGDVSGLVRSDFGYHIIMRVPPNEDDVMRPWGMEPLSLEQRMAQAMQRCFEAMAAEADITFRPALDNVFGGVDN